MVPSFQSNKATSDSNNHNPGTTKIIEQLPPQLVSTQRDAQKQQAVHQEIPRRRWQGLSLRFKATALAIALGTLPVLGIGATAYYFADQSLVKQIKQEKQERAIGIANAVNRFMGDHYGDIQIMANLPIFSNPNQRAATTFQEKQAVLNRFLEVYGIYDSIAVADLAGNTIAQTLGEPVTGLGERDYFKEVIKTKSPVITQPRKSFLTGKYSIFIAAPIVDTATGKMIGVIRSRIPTKFLEDVIENFGTKEDEYHVFDSSGKFFVALEKNQVGRNARADFPMLAQQNAARKVATWVAVDKIDNAMQLVTYAPLGKLVNLPDLKWGVILATDTEIAFASQRQLLLTLAIGTALTALVVSAIAAEMTKRVTRPILAATNAVEKLGQGELDTRVATEGKDELAVLGSNINQMADQLQTLLQSQEAEAERSRFFAEIATFRTREDLGSVFNTAVIRGREILKADRVVVYRFNSNYSGYITAESVLSGWPQALAVKIEDTCIGEHLIEAYTNGRVVPTNNVFETNYSPEHMKLLERLEIKANLVTPILQNNQLFGLLIAHHCHSPHAWQQDEINFLTQLAAQLGLIVGRVNFIQQKEAEAQRAELLKDITLKISQAPSLEDVLTTAVDNIRSGLKTDRVVIYNLDPTTSKGTVLAESVASDWPKSLGEEINDPCFGKEQLERYKKGQVTSINNVYQQPGLTPSDINTLEQFGVKANMIAPIITDNQLFGLLIAHQCSTSRVWQQGEIDLFGQLATSVGFAVDRAHLLYEVEQARLSAEDISQQQRQQKEDLQKRAIELLMEVDPVSKGDLTIRANVTEDEIGTLADSYNSTIGSLRQIVTQVQAAAKQVATTTSSNEASVQELSQAALQQAQEVAATLDQIQEMSNSIQVVAANASQAEAAVKQATQTVVAGDAAMNRTVDGILAIRETVAETAKKVKRLGESSQKISKVVNLISTFADQTNLLALNASIEAANAGEQGRGFAVVADEVRSLARRSAAATAEIESLVTDIQTETNQVVAAMEAGTQQVVTGTKLVDETRQSLNQITAVSTQISALVEAIAEATVSQSQASQTVTKTITNVAANAANNSHSATVVSASFKELLALAQQLQASVGQFKVS